MDQIHIYNDIKIIQLMNDLTIINVVYYTRRGKREGQVVRLAMLRSPWITIHIPKGMRLLIERG